MTKGTIHRVFHSMGIAVHCTLVGISASEADDLVSKAEKIFNEFDARFSRFKKTSELYRLNASGGKPHGVSIDMFQVIKKCVALSEETCGVFDPSVGSVLASYGYGLPENFTLPVPLPTYRDIFFDDITLQITLAPGQILEPASVVKSMAIDEASKVFQGVSGFMMNAGGDIVTHGLFEDGNQWNIAVQDPRDPRAVATAVGVHNVGMATSGVYQTHGEHAGKPWHHLVDMRTGENAHGIMSATVIAPTCEKADSEATISILLGRVEGIARLDKLGLPYFLILDHGAIHKNAAFSALEIPFQNLIQKQNI